MGPISADVQISYASGNIDATRSITVGATGRTAVSNTDGDLFRAIATIGYDLGSDRTKIRPFVGVDFSSGKVKAFTESGAAAANLSVADIDADRTDVLAGVDVKFGVAGILPYGRAVYRYRTNNDTRVVRANFTGVAGSAFAVTAENGGRSEVDIDAGLSYAIGTTGSVSIGYQGAFRDDINRHGVSAQLSSGF